MLRSLTGRVRSLSRSNGPSDGVKAVILEHFNVLVTEPHPISFLRVCVIALVIAGVAVIRTFSFEEGVTRTEVLSSRPAHKGAIGEETGVGT